MRAKSSGCSLLEGEGELLIPPLGSGASRGQERVPCSPDKNRNCVELFLRRRYPMRGSEPGIWNNQDFSAMKSFVFSAETGKRLFSISSRNILTSLLLLMFCWQQMARGQTDDFNDGNDGGWMHLDLSAPPANFPPATNSYPDDDFGGKAYRIFTPAPPDPGFGPA